MSFGIEELAAVTRVMNSGKLSGYQGNYSEQFYGGDEVRALEKEWASYFGVKHAIFTNSATSGLWAACAVLGLNPGDEVVVSPYSMSCSASIPLQFGCKPVFADIEEDYYCISPESVEKAITDRTRAIIAVDLFGLPCDFDVINKIAKKHNLIVIEDAAQACGATYKEHYAGTLSDIGVFSLNRHKIINCGEGGVITTDNDDLAFKLRLVLNHSESVVNDMKRLSIEDYRKYVNVWPGMNLRGTELSAAIAREQLKKLDGILQVVRENAKYFDVKVRPECEHAFYRYAWQKHELAKSPEAWSEALEICTYKYHYITPLYQIPLFQQLGYDQHQCPVCEDVDENIVLAWLKEVI
jgi:dTDP-4-amino-4,6-dideoxygalactose transaminase